ncbi:MAG: heavy-metal-associated domain-containing protein [Bacteroidota bacterium]
MKNIIITVILAIAFISGAAAQNPVVEKTVAVHGDCDMCKLRIEKTASYVKGVKKASWDKDQQQLTVIYREDKTTLAAIEEAIAKAGYDTEHVKANEEAYEKLPECCHYRTSEKH